jgi:putative heme degradation protein
MKPDFDAMSKQELKVYVLSHKSDREAFYKLADRLKADNQDSSWYPYPDTLEAVFLMENVIQEKLNRPHE